MCAASNMNNAPISSAISRNGRGSMMREYAVAPATISFGRSRRATSRTSSKSMRSSDSRHAVGDEPEQLAARVDRRAVREVAALVEAHAEHRVAGLEQ